MFWSLLLHITGWLNRILTRGLKQFLFNSARDSLGIQEHCKQMLVKTTSM